MKLRKKSHEISINETQNYVNSLVESQEDLHPISEKEVQLQALENALENLNEEQKKCIKLFYINEKTYQEVVDETGFEMKKVKSYIQNGKRNLMIQLSKNKTAIILLLTLLKLNN